MAGVFSLLSSEGILCGDCGALEPQWAAVNRGLLLCNECCYCHRSLGPQYSIILHLKESLWSPALWNMVMTLAPSSANHVWEHLLLDRPKGERDSGARKPCPADSVDTKRKFIYLKHGQFHFVPKTPLDQLLVKSQELHSTVRTSALDTCLRLLVGGADPNYFHPERGTRPMHVAARNGQALQVELLHVYGAYMGDLDYLGQSPVEHAMAAGHKDLAQRMLQLRFIVTDTLSHFVCGEKSDHTTSKHIIVPSLPTKPIWQGQGDAASMARTPSFLLERWLADMYDEVERRAVEKVLAKTTGPEYVKLSIAFLPVNSYWSPVRNQIRQKLALVPDIELGQVLTLYLTECERRHWNGPENQPSSVFLKRQSKSPARSVVVPGVPTYFDTDDDFPLYDSVASDEDIVLPEEQKLSAQTTQTVAEAKPVNTSDASNLSTSASTTEVNAYKDSLFYAKLMETDAQNKELKAANKKLLKEVKILGKMVRANIKKNTEQLKQIFSSSPFTQDTQSHAKTSRPNSWSDHLNSNVMMDPEDLERRRMSSERKLSDLTSLTHQTAQRTVKLMKSMIECAEMSNFSTLKNISRDLENCIDRMVASVIVIKEIRERTDVAEILNNLQYQVLRLSYELRDVSSSTPHEELMTLVKSLCYDVGLSLRFLMNLIQDPVARVHQQQLQNPLPST